MNRILNWKKEPDDNRDKRYSLQLKAIPKMILPTLEDLSYIFPKVWDQGNLGSCVSHATNTCVLYSSVVQNRVIDPSRLFLYYTTREIEGTINEDNGCYIRNSFKALSNKGVCAESTWPYNNYFASMPHENAFKEGVSTLGESYSKIDNSNLDELKACLSIHKRPFAFGFLVYSSFLENWSSVMPIPKSNENFEGGHAVTAVGYSDGKQAFKIKNSWGSTWKDGGYFWMPYSFITSRYCDDFWMLERISKKVDVTPDMTSIVKSIFKNEKDLMVKESVLLNVGSLLNVQLDASKPTAYNYEILKNYLFKNK